MPLGDSRSTASPMSSAALITARLPSSTVPLTGFTDKFVTGIPMSSAGPAVFVSGWALELLRLILGGADHRGGDRRRGVLGLCYWSPNRRCGRNWRRKSNCCSNVFKSRGENVDGEPTRSRPDFRYIGREQ